MGEILKSGTAVSADFALQTGSTVLVDLTNRERNDVEPQKVLDRQRAKVLQALNSTRISVVSTSGAEYTLELVDAPHVRWGMYHYQNDFYAFLLVRRQSSGKLLYCAYQRAGFLKSATSALLDHLVAATRTPAVASGNLQQCAGLAMRPL